jgi:hypothetical protein
VLSTFQNTKNSKSSKASSSNAKDLSAEELADDDEKGLTNWINAIEKDNWCDEHRRACVFKPGMLKHYFLDHQDMSRWALELVS